MVCGAGSRRRPRGAVAVALLCAAVVGLLPGGVAFAQVTTVWSATLTAGRGASGGDVWGWRSIPLAMNGDNLTDTTVTFDDPTPSTPLGFAARVAPSWRGEATSGAQALWGRETMTGMAHGGFAQGSRLDGEVGYGLPVGSRLVGTPRAGFSTSEHGRDYRIGYGLGVLDRESLKFELGIDALRRESPLLDRADMGFLGRATVGW